MDDKLASALTEAYGAPNPVQALRWEARDRGDRIGKTLRGITGLSQDEQLSRIGHARDLATELMEVLDEALATVKARDHAEYQASKHQGTSGWFVHVTMVHGVPATEFDGYSDEQKTEFAWQMHMGMDAHQHLDATTTVPDEDDAPTAKVEILPDSWPGDGLTVKYDPETQEWVEVEKKD